VTFVFLHGAGCTPEVFAAQRAAFPDAIVPDLHALAPGASSVADVAGALAPLLASIDGPYALVGSSMGGAVALEAVIAGARPAALIAIGCAPKLRVAASTLAAAENEFDAFVEAMPAALYAEPTPARAASARRQFEEVGQARTLADFRACDAWDIGERASALRVPVLVLTGERDAMTPVRFGQMLADRIPGARMRILDGAGHLAMAESPADTNEALRAFVSSP
jgi:pimeloyl-ACP methyl ester carboxylesterase